MPPTSTNRVPPDARSLVAGTTRLGGLDPNGSRRWLDGLVAAGCRHFDTAPAYPGSEERLGAWLRGRAEPQSIGPQGRSTELVRRFGAESERDSESDSGSESDAESDNVWIVTKCCHPGSDGTPRVTPSALADDIAASRVRLGRPTLDAVLFHRDDPRVPVGELVDAMSAQIDLGHVAAWGVSNWSRDRVAAALDWARREGRALPTLVSQQFGVVGFERPPWPGTRSWVHEPDETRQLVAAAGLTLLAWSPLAGGWLTDETPAAGTPYDSAPNRARHAALHDLARARGTTAAATAIAWMAHAWPEAVPVVSCGDGDRFGALAAARRSPLTAEEAACLPDEDR